MTDKIYGYESITKVSGEIKDDSFNPIIYKSKTKSSKQDRYENIIFDENFKLGEITFSESNTVNYEVDITKTLGNTPIDETENV